MIKLMTYYILVAITLAIATVTILSNTGCATVFKEDPLWRPTHRCEDAADCRKIYGNRNRFL